MCAAYILEAFRVHDVLRQYTHEVQHGLLPISVFGAFWNTVMGMWWLHVTRMTNDFGVYKMTDESNILEMK